ncbi:inosine/xanthosine triphosphatase [Candidatus Micrarchaeota archaeon]|nr:inosine/xanthosine triphosphatase [Candidatus Micrarchaeota archaeon]
MCFVAIGSVNPAKIKAVEKAFLHYFDDLQVKSFEVDSGVHHQPKSLDEMALGAANRAKNAYSAAGKADFGVGIESGLFTTPGFSRKHLTGGLAAVFDGKHIHIGISPCFEVPPNVVEKVIKEISEVGTVFDEMLKRKNVKHGEGAVGVLSKGRFTRGDMLSLGVAMALAPIVSSELFR